ncbi:hypothetical protein [Gelidibacter maritimus]|uniref:Uncharacterized protein n=1 Tax=Gelidibacter maritimus TaxID=2761487 RepID=A0A7W2R3D5_9FLAO|nr:hypothetical protein [Gelidibacter maritimus]MBA6152741.1 hypothetical protein [Gelidibacter maritimus]
MWEVESRWVSGEVELEVARLTDGVGQEIKIEFEIEIEIEIEVEIEFEELLRGCPLFTVRASGRSPQAQLEE